jgi:hypothetical protein
VYHHHPRSEFCWILYTISFIRVTTLYGLSHGDWSWVLLFCVGGLIEPHFVAWSTCQ